MHNILIYFFLFILTTPLYSQINNKQTQFFHLNKKNTDTVYLSKNKEYYYSAIYIDQSGDTITKDEIILKPLARPWWPQFRVQQAIRYIYKTDTIGYHDFVNPIESLHERNQRKYNKKGRFPLVKKETTGATYNNSIFYMHPPRANQFYMLFYSIHPRIKLKKLTDSITESESKLVIPTLGVFNWHSTINPKNDSLLFGRKVKVWEINTISTGDIKEEDKKKGIYDSKMVALFTREFGYIKQLYTFENNIKMNFELRNIKTLIK